MIKIALVVPCNGFIENAFSIFEEHNAAMPSYDGESYTMEEITLNSDNAPVKIDADIILTRGLLAEILQKIKDEIPMVEIPIPTADILRTIRHSSQLYGQKKIGIIAANNMLAGINGLSDLADSEIRTYVLGTDWNGSALVDQALSDGCEIILGGLNTCNYAAMINANNFMIGTSKEAFWQALTATKQTATYTRREQEKSSRLHTILDASSDGILALDMGKRIQLINQKAQQLLKTDFSIVGKTVTDVPFPLEFKDLLCNNQEYTCELFRYKNDMFNISKYFFKLKNVVSGTIVTLQTVKDIQNLEGAIRNRIYNKGHIAKMTFQDIIGNSPIMKDTIRTAIKFSSTSSNILLIGESGTGKEVFAQSIHNASLRRHTPFVAINCAAIPDQLLESELFGYAPGAFTGANKEGKLGLFEIAHGGTLFLDEIGEIPLSLQAKLLRVLQERQIMRIGSDKLIPVDIRIISATNKDLKQWSENHLFREDLFYRLDVLRIHLPSLRQRAQDIPLLVAHYLKSNFPLVSITKEANARLAQYNWPGNIRQLFNICERLAVLCEHRLIEADDIALHLSGVMEHILLLDKNQNTHSTAPFDCPADSSTQLIHALEVNHYSKEKTAKYLGISRSTLWRKMKELE